MSKGGKVYLAGDLHFCDKGIINICNRPFKTVDDMNKQLIYNWNSIIEPNSRIIVNGDLSFTTDEEALREVIRNLTGEIILIKGNHDTFGNKVYMDMGISCVYDYPIIIDDFYVISHEPMFIPEGSPYVNLFSHVHNNPNYKDVSSGGFCTSYERKYMSYKPLEINDIKILIANEVERENLKRG